MKTFTVILTTVTFLVFAFIVVAIMQDEPEVIPPENLTSGISDSSTQGNTAQPNDLGTAIDPRPTGIQRGGNNQAEQTPRATGSSQSSQDRDVTNRPGHSPTAGQGDQRPTGNDHRTGQVPGQWGTGMMPDDRQEPKSSFTIPEEGVEIKINDMRQNQMKILQEIISQ